MRAADLPKLAAAAGCQVREHPDEGSEHTTGDVKYKTNPPTSGDHDPQWPEDGVYTEAPDLEQTVHLLEHGRILIQYKPGLDPKVVEQLEGVAMEETKGTAGYHTAMFPNQTDMPSEVAATAWRHSLTCETFKPAALDAIRAFRATYVDKGPEFVP